MTQKPITEQVAEPVAEPQIEFNPGESIFPAMTAQEALCEALEHLMSRATEDGPMGEYPSWEEVDQLAPSLKGQVMRGIRERNLMPCNHDFSTLANLAYDVVSKIPEQEVSAVIGRMKKLGA